MVRCEYCMRRFNKQEKKCHGCGAPFSHQHEPVIIHGETIHKESPQAKSVIIIFFIMVAIVIIVSTIFLVVIR